MKEYIKSHGIRKDFSNEVYGYFDIEATHLKANFGFILSWYIKVADKHDQFWYDRRENGHPCDCVPEFIFWTISRKEALSDTEDVNGIRKLLKVMPRFSGIKTFYGTWYDDPFIKTRALIHYSEGLISEDELEPIFHGRLKHIDVYKAVKENLSLHSRRLEVLESEFGIGEKTDVNAKIWRRAAKGNREALRYVSEHCRRDVLGLEKAACMMNRFQGYRRTSF